MKVAKVQICGSYVAFYDPETNADIYCNSFPVNVDFRGRHGIVQAQTLDYHSRVRGIRLASSWSGGLVESPHGTAVGVVAVGVTGVVAADGVDVPPTAGRCGTRTSM